MNGELVEEIVLGPNMIDGRNTLASGSAASTAFSPCALPRA